MGALALPIGLLGLAVGLGIAFSALRRPVVDAAAVLADLEGADGQVDEYTEKLSLPLSSRILSPLGAKVGRIVQSILPGNYLDGLRRRFFL